MKNCYKMSRVVLPILALALTCGSARAFQAAASDATQSGADSSAADNARNSAAHAEANSATSDAKATPANAEHAIAQMIPVNGIPKFGEVSPQLYRGAQPSSEGLEYLASLGVEIIVNLRPGEHLDEEQEAIRLGMRYVSIPWHCYHPND